MFRTSFLLVMLAGLWAFAGAFDAQGDELPKPKRNGLFVYGACDAPEGLVVNTGSIQLYVRDETLEVTTVELAAFDPKTGWQSARTESDHQYYLRMADPNVLEWAFLKEDAPVTAKGAAPGNPEAMKSTVWEYERLNRCANLRGPLALLHGETVAVMLDAGAVPEACAASADLCLKALFNVADTHRDGMLTQAELSRMLRVGAYMAAGASDDVKPADAFGAAASMIPLGPIAASAILASYDYNGDDRISLSELTNDVAPSEAINAAAHSEAVNQLEDVTKKASEALMNMYMSLSGANP